MVPGSGPSRSLSEVVVRRVVEVNGDGEKAEVLCSRYDVVVVAQRARIIDDFVAIADIVAMYNIC